MDTNSCNHWLNATDAKKILRTSGCELMHLREAGKLRFQRRGNAYFYNCEDLVRQAASKRSRNSVY